MSRSTLPLDGRERDPPVQVDLPAVVQEPIRTRAEGARSFHTKYDTYVRMLRSAGVDEFRLGGQWCHSQIELRAAFRLPPDIALGAYATPTSDDVGDPAEDQPDPEPGYSTTAARGAS